MPKLHIKRGDTVKVLSGDDKGKTGRVVRVFPKKGLAIVEGVALIKKRVRKSQRYPQGGVVEVERPIPVSKLQVIDPSTGKPTRVGRRLENGRWVRYAKKSGKVL
ncbi:MAG: 50S ribosomal protein L24 [Bacteroidia bacterium]|nr:50S ribosomal protein L24 [Bacteroidia bacterium]MCX7652704.1 50S ribosomal protein L24 [Bacteroidia bacterium]MDW8416412.1 50S ribosomal protein L24 [Bacteroidia bacterium]